MAHEKTAGIIPESGGTGKSQNREAVVLFGGARLLTSRRRFTLARRVRLARTLAPPKVAKRTTTNREWT